MGSSAYQALAHCDEALGGIESIRVKVRWNQSFESRAILEAIESVHEILSDESLIHHPLSINKILAAFPGDTKLTDRYSYTELMPKELLDRFLNASDQNATITARVQDLGIALFLPVFERVESKLWFLALACGTEAKPGL